MGRGYSWRLCPPLVWGVLDIVGTGVQGPVWFGEEQSLSISTVEFASSMKAEAEALGRKLTGEGAGGQWLTVLFHVTSW